MKFNITVDMDYLDEDELLSSQVENLIIDKTAEKVSKLIQEKQIEKFAASAEKYIRAKTEYFIDNFLEQPITITEGWDKQTRYDSLYDMVEQQISALYTEKLNSKRTCKEDPFLATLKQHVKVEVDNLLTTINKRIELNAKTAAAAELAENKMIAALDAALPKLPTRR